LYHGRVGSPLSADRTRDRNKKNWAKVVGIILGILLLPGIPVGTVLGVFILIGLFSEEANSGLWPEERDRQAIFFAPHKNPIFSHYFLDIPPIFN